MPLEFAVSPAAGPGGDAKLSAEALHENYEQGLLWLLAGIGVPIEGRPPDPV